MEVSCDVTVGDFIGAVDAKIIDLQEKHPYFLILYLSFINWIIESIFWVI